MNNITRVRPVIIATVLIAAMLTLSAGCADLFEDTEIYPKIETDGTGEYVPVSYSFNFQDRTVKLTVPVDKAVYAAAYDADKQAYLYQETISDDTWTDPYYRSFIDDESLTPLYDAILTEMRKIKSQLSLDADSYAELIIAYVQSMPYSTNSVRSEPKFPIETVYERKGDCDDKSLLAAALLSREGYDVALLLFDDESHMALGIRLPPEKSHISYANTGYAYVETTIGHYVGWPDITLDDDTEITSAPHLTKIGNGTLTYRSMNEIESIYAAYKKCDDVTDSLLPRIEAKERELDGMESRLTSMEATARRLKTQNVAEYNRLVPEYNALVNRYNAASTELDGYISRYNYAVGLSEYIAKHTYDRQGVYEKVRRAGNIY